MINRGEALPYFYLVVIVLALILILLIIAGFWYCIYQCWYPYEVLQLPDEKYLDRIEELKEKERIY